MVIESKLERLGTMLGDMLSRTESTLELGIWRLEGGIPWVEYEQTETADGGPYYEFDVWS